MSPSVLGAVITAAVFTYIVAVAYEKASREEAIFWVIVGFAATFVAYKFL